MTRMLLEYWSDPERDNEIMFYQGEAVETAIYLAEAAAEQSEAWIHNQLPDRIGDPATAIADLDDAVQRMYVDGPITGLPS